MSRQFQYQEFTEPTGPPTIDPAKSVTPGANEPWRDPIQLSIKVISTALIASQVLSFVPPSNGSNDWRETITESRWHQPWSEPVRVAPRDAWFQPDILTRTATDVTGIKYLPLSEPVRTPPRDVWFQTTAYTESAPFPETITETRWHQPWSEPVRAPLRTVWYQDETFNPFPLPPAQVGLASGSWSQPIQTATLQYQGQTLGRPASDVTGLQYPPLSEPQIKTPPRDAWYQELAFNSPLSAAPAESWFPVFPDRALAAARTPWFQDLTFYPFPLPAATVVEAWFEPLSEPVRTTLDKLAVALASSGGIGGPNTGFCAFFQGAFSQLSFATCFTPNIAEFYIPLSEPVRVPPRSVEFPNPAFVAIVQQDVVTSWYVPLSDPVRVPLRDAWFQDLTFAPNPVVSFSYYAPLSEPVRTPPRDVWFQPDTKSTQPFVSFSYYEPLSEPVRTALRDAWYQPDTLTRTASDVTGLQYPPLSEPVRTALRDVWYQDKASYTESAPFPEEVSEDRWHQPWSEPVRQPPRDVWFQNLALAPNPIVSFSWFEPLTDPVRVLPRDVWFQPDTLTRTASDVTGIQYLALAEPVRTPLRDAWYQDATSFNPFPLPPVTVLVSEWRGAYPDFAPAAVRVVYNQELAFVVGAVVPTPITSLQSWEPWVDPPPPLPIIALREGWPTYIDTTDLPPTDTGKVWRRYWIQADPYNVLNRDAPHDLVWTDEDDVITVTLLL